MLLGTAAYLGLAVLGWGGFVAFFSHPALIALALVLFAISGAALFAGGNLSPREDRSNRWVIIAFGPIGLALAYLPAYDDAGQLTSRIAFGLTDGRVGRSYERYI